MGVLDGAPWEMFGSVCAVAFDEDRVVRLLGDELLESAETG